MADRCSPGANSGAILHRADRHYRRLLHRDLEARLMLKRQLRSLAAYHRGTDRDFTTVRDRYLARMLRFASDHSPYYADVLPTHNLLKKISPRDPAWAEIPRLDRATIRARASSIVTAPETCRWMSKLTTGGSTGEPLAFFYMGGHDAEHQEFLWRLHGYCDGDRILAMDGTVVGAELIAAGKFWMEKSPKELPYGGTALSGHYLNDETRETYVDYLMQSRPEFIRGYPSLVTEVAEALLARGETLRCKGVELSSESHSSAQVAVIEAAFGPVFDQYGHAEASLFGYSLTSDGPVYCSPLYGLVEVLDDDGRQVEPGESGEVTVTGFHNFGMPFIRYQTGDLAVFDGERDGITRLRQVMGRTQDHVVSDTGVKHLVTAFVFGRHYAAFENIDRWQIIQDEPGRVTIRIDRGAEYSHSDEQEILRNFKELAGIDTEFDYVSGISRTGRAKSPLVIQRVVRGDVT